MTLLKESNMYNICTLLLISANCYKLITYSLDVEIKKKQMHIVLHSNFMHALYMCMCSPKLICVNICMQVKD